MASEMPSSAAISWKDNIYPDRGGGVRVGVSIAEGGILPAVVGDQIEGTVVGIPRKLALVRQLCRPWSLTIQSLGVLV